MSIKTLTRYMYMKSNKVKHETSKLYKENNQSNPKLKQTTKCFFLENCLQFSRKQAFLAKTGALVWWLSHPEATSKGTHLADVILEPICSIHKLFNCICFRLALLELLGTRNAKLKHILQSHCLSLIGLGCLFLTNPGRIIDIIKVYGK